MKKVSGPHVVTSGEALESPLPPRIQEALGELVGAAREGLLALSVGVASLCELVDGGVEHYRPLPRRSEIGFGLFVYVAWTADKYQHLRNIDASVRRWIGKRDTRRK